MDIHKVSLEYFFEFQTLFSPARVMEYMIFSRFEFDNHIIPKHTLSGLLN